MGNLFENTKEENIVKEENIKFTEEDNIVEENPENITVTQEKKESLDNKNNISFAICIALVAFISAIIGVFIGSSLIGTSPSNLIVSDSGNNRTEIVSVDNNNTLLSASEIYANNINSIAYIQTEIIHTNFFGQSIKGASAGSGFVVSEDGYIVTNYHVVDGASNIKVSMINNKEYEANLIGYEEENDIAVLKINSEDTFTPVVLGNSDETIVGEDVVAIGNPLGELTYSLTKGVVSGFDREIYLDNYTEINMFQVDCALNEGNSGGPVFNMYGEVIGVVSAKYASETIEGLGFCIPISDVINILPDLIENGKVMNKAYFGISVTDVNDEMIAQLNLVKGAYVSMVEKDTCAEKAGLKIGDIIVEIDGEKIESVSNLLSAKRNYKAGDTAKLKVWRSGDYVDLSITFDKYDEKTMNKIEEENKKIEDELKQFYQDFAQNNQNQNQNNPSMQDIEDLFKHYFGY